MVDIVNSAERLLRPLLLERLDGRVRERRYRQFSRKAFETRADSPALRPALSHLVDIVNSAERLLRPDAALWSCPSEWTSRYRQFSRKAFETPAASSAAFHIVYFAVDIVNSAERLLRQADVGDVERHEDVDIVNSAERLLRQEVRPSVS